MDQMKNPHFAKQMTGGQQLSDKQKEQIAHQQKVKSFTWRYFNCLITLKIELSNPLVLSLKYITCLFYI